MKIPNKPSTAVAVCWLAAKRGALLLLILSTAACNSTPSASLTDAVLAQPSISVTPAAVSVGVTPTPEFAETFSVMLSEMRTENHLLWEERVLIENCEGQANVTDRRLHSYTVKHELTDTGGFEVSASGQVSILGTGVELGAKLAGSRSVAYGETETVEKEIVFLAPAGTFMEYTVGYFDVLRVGNAVVTIGGITETIPYKYREGFAIASTDSRQLPCETPSSLPTSTATPLPPTASPTVTATNTRTPPTATPLPPAASPTATATDTRTPAPTAAPLPPTASPTATDPRTPINTQVRIPTATAVRATATSLPPIASPTVTATDTRTPAPTATATPTRVAVATPSDSQCRSWSDDLVPTQPVHTAIVLGQPEVGAVFTGPRANISLSWQSSPLRDGQQYLVVLRYPNKDGIYYYDYQYIRETSLIVPRHIFDNMLSPSRDVTWFVVIFEGEVCKAESWGLRGSVVSAKSDTRVFFWKLPVTGTSGSETTPPPTPPPDPPEPSPTPA